MKKKKYYYLKCNSIYMYEGGTKYNKKLIKKIAYVYR